MTKEEFKIRWESNDHGGGICFDDIAECAKKWGVSPAPRICRMENIRYRVLLAAGTVDAEEYNPEVLNKERDN